MPNTRSRIAIAHLALASLAATACPDPVAGESKPEQLDEGPGPSEAGVSGVCTAEQITSGKLIAQRTFKRAKGKPVIETLQFLTAPGDEVCILLQAGATDAGGDQLLPAPASLTVEVDAIEIAAPNDVNVHPRVFARRLGPDELPAGAHTLSAELHGKPSSVLGVSVFALSDDLPAGFSDVTYTRLVDPSKNLTTVRDEMVVGADLGTTREALQASLSGLPFTAVIIGQSQTAPFFQLFVPGFSLDEPAAYVAAIEALPTVEYAAPHYASMLAMNAALFPPAGSDPFYLNDANDSTVVDGDAAWHLTQIFAPHAWGEQHDGAPVGLLDAGFDMGLADLDSATCVEIGGNCSPILGDYAACTAIDSCDDPQNCPGPDSDLCTEVRECWGAPKESVFHGNSTAGLIAGRSDDQGVVGLSWNSLLLLDVLNREANKTINDPFAGKDRHMAMAEVQAPLDRFVLHDPPARIINLNFGVRKFCFPPGSQPAHNEDDADELRDYLDATGKMMATFLSANRGVLIVEAAGNEGEKDVPSHEGGFGRRLRDPEFFTRNPKTDRSVLEQLLSVGASTAEYEVAKYTNPGGSPLVAPVGVDWDEEGDNILGLGANVDALPEPLSGTSFAAPQVAGVASLMLAENPKLAANHIQRILLGTANDVLDDSYYRLLDAYEAVREAKRWTCSGYTETGSGVCPVFWDLSPEEDRYFTSIYELSCHCVLKGYPEGDFRAAQSINRAEMLKVVVETLYPQSEIAKFEGKSSSFPDVPTGEWYAKYVALAEAHDFITGINGLFLPGNPVNRAEAVTILARAAYAMGVAGIVAPAGSRVELLAARYVVHGGPDDVMPPQPLPKTFPDVAPADWFYPSVEATADLCIFGGTDTDQDPNTAQEFLPGAPLQRGEAAHLACRTRFADDAVCSPKSCAK